MSSFDPLIQAVWRDVSRHLDIGESTETTAAVLRKQMPLETLVIRQLDSEHRRVRTVATWPVNAYGASDHESDLSRADWRRLEHWVERGPVLHQSADGKKASETFELLKLPAVSNDWLLAPLTGEHGSYGVVFAAARSGEAFTKQNAALLAALREPMGVALDNDARLHELAALREAAEAEKQSLLRRLGRSDVGDTIVGEDSGLGQVMQRVDLVSRSEVPVLILGETGTGKELVARAIHNRSERHSGPFLRVNCGAIPRELIDSQLFGHEKGAFTGANETRQGWFERADQGTLFLDEIGELPLDAQVRFLRVLQDGFVERVGGTKPIRVDVRVVAATHRDLAGMVQEGGFREDLWYRIAVFPILLPPLRDRVEDIPALSRHFARRAAIRFGLAPVEPTEADFELLRTYRWPGNIRELGAVIDRAAILGNGNALELAAALGVATPQSRYAAPSEAAPNIGVGIQRGGKIATLNDAMRAHIEAALSATRGRIEGARGAARLLGINPHTLRARMRKLKIDWSVFRETDGGVS
ncbi:MAG: sigma-54 dependent transcriptional regulator [Planctomycetes bacterium]|nr:sigma-54 dependent transcriptional regulator [Planctomycetota bacterium]